MLFLGLLISVSVSALYFEGSKIAVCSVCEDRFD